MSTWKLSMMNAFRRWRRNSVNVFTTEAFRKRADAIYGNIPAITLVDFSVQLQKAHPVNQIKTQPSQVEQQVDNSETEQSLIGDAKVMDWEMLTDQQWGGKSAGHFVAKDGVGILTGNVCTEHPSPKMRAGYVALKTKDLYYPWDFRDFHGIQLKAKPDDRIYVFSIEEENQLRTTNMKLLHQVMFKALPTTKDPLSDWHIFTFPWTDFTFTVNGNKSKFSGPVDPERIKSIHIGPALGNEGTFRIEILSLKVVQLIAQERYDPLKIPE